MTYMDVFSVRCVCVSRVCTQEDEQWTDAFDRASDAIGWSANREQAWDDLLSQPGANNVVDVCVCVCVCVCVVCVCPMCMCVRVRHVSQREVEISHTHTHTPMHTGGNKTAKSNYAQGV